MLKINQGGVNTYKGAIFFLLGGVILTALGKGISSKKFNEDLIEIIQTMTGINIKRIRRDKRTTFWDKSPFSRL